MRSIIRWTQTRMLMPLFSFLVLPQPLRLIRRNRHEAAIRLPLCRHVQPRVQHHTKVLLKVPLLYASTFAGECMQTVTDLYAAIEFDAEIPTVRAIVVICERAVRRVPPGSETWVRARA
jgi:hypothetical protein